MAWSDAARQAALAARQAAKQPNAVKSTFSSKRGVGPHGPGMYATTNDGTTVKLNPAATGGRIPGVGTQIDPSQHTTVAAHAAGINQVGRTDISHPAYNTASQPPKYNAPVTPLSADFRTGGQMLRQRFSDFSKEQHLAAGDEHARQAGSFSTQHSAAVGNAMKGLGGRDPGPLVSGVVSSRFSEGEKDNLRKLAVTGSKHADAAMAHYAAAGMHLDTARARYRSNKGV